jgi:hypothetical protein
MTKTTEPIAPASRPEAPRPDELGDLLRHADPARIVPTPRPEELAAARRAVLAAAASPSRSRRHLSFAVASLAAILLAAGAAWWGSLGGPSAGVPPAPDARTLLASRPGTADGVIRAQQIQFVTPGGIRVLWTLTEHTLLDEDTGPANGPGGTS